MWIYHVPTEAICNKSLPVHQAVELGLGVDVPDLVFRHPEGCGARFPEKPQHGPVSSIFLNVTVTLTSQMQFFPSKVHLIPRFGMPVVDPQAQRPHEQCQKQKEKKSRYHFPGTSE